MTNIKLQLPHQFEPRAYQWPVIEHMRKGGDRGVMLWHRRAGKDKTALNWMVEAAFQRVGLYYYFFPTYAQGKKIMWEGRAAPPPQGDGLAMLDHFPKDLIEDRHETELKLTLKNGSIFQIIGTDNYDAIRGSNPIGCAFSEYSYQNPAVWDVVEPILVENKGWALFVFTPNGKNHGHRLFQMAESNDRWFCEKRTIAQTFLENGQPVISKEQVDQLRAEGKTEEYINREFYCSFEGSTEGSYYGEQLRLANLSHRIGRVPWEPTSLVHTSWDLGVGDATAIWFFQQSKKERHYIDYYQASGEGLVHYAKILKEKPYVYGDHLAPHDIKVREFSSGISRIDAARKLNIRFRIVPKHKVDERIDAVRRGFPGCWFDADKCAQGLDALGAYKKLWNEKQMEWTEKPHHDWSSHGADAFGTGFMEKVIDRDRTKVQEVAETDYNPYA